MAEDALPVSTGDPVADGWLRESVAALREAFGERLRAVYVIGSRADGSATAASDLDLVPVLRGSPDPSDAARGRGVVEELYARRRIPLDAVPVHDVAFPGWSLLPLREGSLLAWGEEVRGEIAAPSPGRAARWALFTALHFSRAIRGAGGPLPFPLPAPDPDGPFLGYDDGTVLGPDGREVPSTRDLVCCVGRVAAALVTFRGRVLVPGKAAAFRLYPEVVNDGWSGLVVAVLRRCRDEWGYLVPPAVRDRAALRDLCERGLAFENHGMEVYRGFLVEEMRGDDPEGRRIAAEALGRIVYPGDGEIREALARLAAGEEGETAALARKAMEAQEGGGGG